MSLDQGLWSDYAVIIYPVVAILVSTVTVVALQRYSEHRLSPRQALLLPFVAGVGEVLFLEIAGQEVWFWLFVGTAIMISSSFALGIAVSDREIEYSAIALGLVVSGLLLAHLSPTVPFRWTLVLAGLVSAFGFGIGYEFSSVGWTPPERSASVE